MSEFSEHLKKAIENSGCTIYFLAKEINYDRATLNNQINGKRKMPKDVFLKLLDIVNLTEKTKSDLMYLFHIDTLGSDYTVIESVMDAFSKYASNDRYNSSMKNLGLNYKVENLKSSITDDEASIIYLIKSFVSEELKDDNPTIYFNLDLDKQEILSIMHYAYTSAKDKSDIKNILSFSLNKHDSIDNFKKITNILPLLLKGYCPYYCFNETNNNHRAFLLFPYYVLTKQRLFLISQSFSNAVVISDKTVINSYMREFEKKLSLCKRFDCPSTSIFEIPYILNRSITSNEETILYGISDTFSAAPFFSKKHWYYMFSDTVPNYEVLADEFLSAYKSVNKFYMYSPTDALYDFIDTGTEGCTNNKYSKPLKVIHRIEVLQKMKAFVENGGHFHFIKDWPEFSKWMVFNVISDSRMLFLNYSSVSENDTVKVISTFGGALGVLKKFFEILPQSCYVMSEEDTILTLENGIKYAKSLLNTDNM